MYGMPSLGFLQPTHHYKSFGELLPKKVCSSHITVEDETCGFEMKLIMTMNNKLL